MSRNIKLEIEYDGTDFHGWQIQPNLRTVQGELENGIQTIFNHQVKLTGSGRTDVGVHALGQVANFHTESGLDEKSILKALNGVLPCDILIKKAEEVGLQFNARFSAMSRSYRYRIFLGRTAVSRRYSWEVLYPLDMEKIMETTRLILREHDFSSFCVAESAKEDNTCRVISSQWERCGEELIFEIEANRFLHSMVRSLVGTLIEVGRGYYSIADFEEIMEARDRTKAGPTAPACGLYLMEVKY
jgi:tRNA pseudouridine38-40 synthase